MKIAKIKKRRFKDYMDLIETCKEQLGVQEKMDVSSLYMSKDLVTLGRNLIYKEERERHLKKNALALEWLNYGPNEALKTHLKPNTVIYIESIDSLS